MHRLLIAVLFVGAVTGQSAPAAHQMHATRSTPAAPLDINTASVTQLAALPGMGWEYAQRVIASRPYHAKNQLSQLGILPDAEYQRIKDLIVAHRVHAPETRRQGAATAACGGAKK